MKKCYEQRFSLGIAGYVYAEHTAIKRSFAAIVVVSISVIFFIYVFTLLFAMISSTRKYFKGSIPAEIFYSEVFRDKTPLEGYKNMLYNETKRIQDKIQRTGSINRKHIRQYRSILRVSLVLVAMFIFAVFKRFFSGS